MFFSDATIKKLIEEKRIEIYPKIDSDDIRPTGIRVHLNDEILIPVENQIIDLESTNDILYDRKKINENGFILKKNMFILGSTIERIKTARDILGHLEGRSTIARLGLQIHCTSGVIDSNYDDPRTVVLEIKNIGLFDLILRPGIPIGMLLLSQLSEPIIQKSQSQYRNQDGVEPPNIKFKTSKKRKIERNEY